MYVVLVNDDNSLSAPKKQRIIQRSKLVNDFYFLVHPDYNGINMSECTVVLEYLKPVSKTYKSEILVLSEDKYEEYLKYVLPIDTEFTEEAGSLELQLSFIKVDISADGVSSQYVRKTAPTLKVEIIPISAWSDIIPDEALNSLDQKIIEFDARIKAVNDMNQIALDGKADDISYENDKLQLVANGKKIGHAVNINSFDEEDIENGVPVVDFNSSNPIAPDGNVDNVVEF